VSDDASIRQLNAPGPIDVQASAAGVPRVIIHHGQSVRVADVFDVWRVDDEWWREPIRRRSVQVTLEDGAELTVYQDLVSGAWYEQRY
jgi:hypothetical protein